MKRAASIRLVPHEDHVHLVLLNDNGQPIADALLNREDALRIGSDLLFDMRPWPEDEQKEIPN